MVLTVTRNTKPIYEDALGTVGLIDHLLLRVTGELYYP